MSLDTALAEVFEALPPGWFFTRLINHGPLGWESRAHTFNQPEYHRIVAGGTSAVDTLQRLAKALRETPR